MFTFWQEFFKKHKISNTMLIAIATVIGYVYTLMFEIGYLNYFGINFQSARIVTESFILCGIVLLAVLAYFYAMGYPWVILHFSTYMDLSTSKWANKLVGYFVSSSLISTALMPFSMYYQDFSWKGYFSIAWMVFLVIGLYDLAYLGITHLQPRVRTHGQIIRSACRCLSFCLLEWGWPYQVENCSQ